MLRAIADVQKNKQGQRRLADVAEQRRRDEQERVGELQLELNQVRAERQKAQRAQVALRAIELELEDEREAHRKTEVRLKQAVG